MHEPELPAFLHDVEVVDASPVIERAIAEADADLAAGRSIFCENEEAFDALLADFEAHAQAS